MGAGLSSAAASASTRLDRRSLAADRAIPIQRGRLLVAAVEAVDELGYGALTVSRLSQRAGVSRRTFYELFCDAEDCFLAAFEHAVMKARALARDAYVHSTCWREGVRTALASLLALMDTETALARACVLGSLSAGTRVSARRAQVLAHLAAVLDSGQVPSLEATELPRVTSEVVVGGVLAVLQTRLWVPPAEPLSNLLGPLMSFVMLPYVGVRAALEELDRMPPRVYLGTLRCAALQMDPLAGIDIRVTYRTARVLAAIARRPGGSSREIGQDAGAPDSGQISKLLGRLGRLGLVENLAASDPRGAGSTWRLTPRGWYLEQATRHLLR